MIRPGLTSHYPLLATGVVLALVGTVVRAGQVSGTGQAAQPPKATEELVHDLGNVATPTEEKRVRGGAYWGVPSQQVYDVAAWIALAQERGFTQVILAGHSVGAPAVQSYQAEKQDERVVGLIIASGRVQPSTTQWDPETLAQAKQLVADGRGEELLRFPNRPMSFTSAATFLDLATRGPIHTDFFGVQTPNPAVTRIRCPILAWFGTKEADIGTAADLEREAWTLALHVRCHDAADISASRDEHHQRVDRRRDHARRRGSRRRDGWRRRAAAVRAGPDRGGLVGHSRRAGGHT
jgi:pimeloyl-ACP methyl ester carboxylesterase